LARYDNWMEKIMKRILSVALLMTAVALVSACSKKQNVVDPPDAGTQVPANAGAEGASTSSRALGGGASTEGGAAGDATGPLAKRVIYFDFDKSEIRPEFADIVAFHARNLTSHPNLHVKLEGNTDERGTREYNIGLGERRAQAVRRALMLQGVAESQLTTVSFGSERPAAEGDDEAAWALNRRVELVYTP
jgi:peptidoglycan-associated lipoprotein